MLYPAFMGISSTGWDCINPTSVWPVQVSYQLAHKMLCLLSVWHKLHWCSIICFYTYITLANPCRVKGSSEATMPPRHMNCAKVTDMWVWVSHRLLCWLHCLSVHRVFFVGGGKWTHRSRLSVFLNKNVNLRLLTWFPLRRDVTISHFV